MMIYQLECSANDAQKVLNEKGGLDIYHYDSNDPMKQGVVDMGLFASPAWHANLEVLLAGLAIGVGVPEGFPVREGYTVDGTTGIPYRLLESSPAQ